MEVEEDAGELPADVACYLVPSVAASIHYHELFCLDAARGTCLTQTAYAALLAQLKPKEWRGFRSHFTDRRFGCAVLSNENNADMWIPRGAGEATDKHRECLVAAAAGWLATHLQERMPVVLLAEDDAEAERLRAHNPPSNVRVVSLAEHVGSAWADDAEATALYRSLADAREEAAKNPPLAGASEFGYTPYMPTAALQAGIKSGLLLSGILHVVPSSAHGYVRAAPREEDDFELEADVLVLDAADRNRAVHGDVVVVEVHPMSRWPSPRRRCGRVVGVLESGWRDYVATAQASDVGLTDDEETTSTAADSLTDPAASGLPSVLGAGRVLVVPMDPRAPKIRVATRDRAALAHSRLVVRIDAWPLHSRWPEGHVAFQLGPIGDLETETKALLLEHGLHAPPFTPAQLAEMPQSPTTWQPEPNEIARRRDLRRSHLLFSIDPLGCEDVDDVIGVQPLPNGHTELSVHIADVAHFVRPGMLTDAEARSRATTVYLVDRRYDMLPAALSAHVCSLHADVDRYAVSVLWELDADARLVRQWSGRTLIRSRYKLHYELAQRLAETGGDLAGDDKQTAAAGTGITQPKRGKATATLTASPTDAATAAADAEARACLPGLAELAPAAQATALRTLRARIRLLIQTAQQLQRRRADAGGLRLESDELRVQLDPARHASVQALLPKHELPIHSVVAECMILANEAVAGRISSARPGAAVLRHHPLPVQEQFGELRRAAAARGVTVDTRSNRALAASLDAAAALTDPATDRILRQLATQAMNEAAYFNTGDVAPEHWFHYGLGLAVYTHFTSPIRRYADVLVHRTLHAVLAAEQVGDDDDTSDTGPAEAERSGDGGAGQARHAGETQDQSTTTGKTHHHSATAAFKATLESEAPSARELAPMCANINTKNRASKLAQRDSVQFFQALYYRQLLATDAVATGAGPAVLANATVVQLLDDGVVIYVAEQGLKIPVRFSYDESTRASGARATPTFAVPSSLFSGNTSDIAIVAGCRLAMLDAGLEVEGGGRRVVLGLLSHVCVGVQVAESRYRPPRVTCVLIRPLEEPAPLPQVGQRQAHAKVVAEVLAQHRPEPPKAAASAGKQTTDDKHSLYDLFDAMAELALQEDGEDAVA